MSMFRLFYKSVAELEEKDLILLKKQSLQIATLSEDLSKWLHGFVEDRKKRRNPLYVTRRDTEIRKILSQILTLLHSEDKKAKDAIRRELQREQGG